MKSTFFGIVLVVLLSITAIPLPLSSDGSATLQSTIGPSLANLSVEHVDDVPYVWQEINGFCLWASLSMVFQQAGAPIDLATLFAVSGIGFSIFYVRDGQISAMLPGPWFRQIPPAGDVSELYGLNCTFVFDPNTGRGAAWASYLDAIAEPYATLDGESGAFTFLRNSIDEGHPLVLFSDPYYLPPVDYDVAREQNITSQESGGLHAIVAMGYNDTAETVQIMDPGVGAFGDDLYGYPSDGRWYYSMNYSLLNETWSPSGYCAYLIKSQGVPVEDLGFQVANMICNRLLGDPSTYMPEQNDTSLYHFGANAFRGMSNDFSPLGLIRYLDEFASRDMKVLVLRHLPYWIEQGMIMQYLSYRNALQVLPQLVPELDLTTFVSIGEQALPHMEALSDNDSLLLLDLSNHHSLVFDTFRGIADSYASSNDLALALLEYSGNLLTISNHFAAIANVWQTAGTHLQDLLYPNPLKSLVPVALGISLMVCITMFGVLLFRRRSRTLPSDNAETHGEY